MGAFKNTAVVLGAILFITMCGNSANAAEVTLTYRLPRATVDSYLHSYDFDYRDTFDTYDEAVAAIANWDDNYYDAYMVEYEAWGWECAKIANEVKSNIRYKNLGKASVLLPQTRFGELESIITKDVDVVELIVPPYEFPYSPPRGKPYREAYCAYCQIISDGLTEYDWRFLRFALYDIFDYRERGTQISYRYEEADEAISELAEKGFISVAPHKKSTYEKIAGTLGDKYDLEITDKGKEYLNSRVERLWSFREGLAKEAYSREKITRAEYEQIQKDNKFIKEAYLKQIKKPADWRGTGDPGVTELVDEWGKLFGRKSSKEKLKKAIRTFEVGDDKVTDPHPYTRVIQCVPRYKDVPKTRFEEIPMSGTYIRDAAGNLERVDL